MVEDDPTIEPGIGDADTARPQELPIRTAEKAEHPVDSNPEGAVGQDSKTNQPILRGVLASGAVALFIATIYAYLEVAGLIHVGTARVILFFGWLVGVIGIVVSEQIWGRTLKHKLRVGMVASLALAAILFLLDVWTVRHLPPAPVTMADAPRIAQELARILRQRITPSDDASRKTVEFTANSIRTPVIPGGRQPRQTRIPERPATPLLRILKFEPLRNTETNALGVNVFFRVDGSQPRHVKSFYRVVVTNFPGDDDDPKLEDLLFDGMLRNKQIGTDMGDTPPGRDLYVSALGGPIPSEAFQKIKDKKAAAYFMGRFEYLGPNGDPYYSDYCGFLMGDPPPIFLCKHHNAP